ncbi:neuraminidase-like domain-containing protein [Enterobacter kobei]|uniref:Tc toxin subunit A-related protein n=1 Tax=Enterobacter kobei TaxID=208224 RepID=UPI003CEC9A13
MNAIDHILAKIGHNTSDISKLLNLSRLQLRAAVNNKLSTTEFRALFSYLKQERDKNVVVESGILGRANPQLKNAVRFGIQQSRYLQSYNEAFPDRTTNFVGDGSVASMFSPAGYLTELYREARVLYAKDSKYHLDTRRPDLAGLALSQSNMDDEISTLSLSNELLTANVLANSPDITNYDEMINTLNDDVLTGSTPFNLHYETTRQAILLRDPAFNAFSRNSVVANQMDPATLLAIQWDIPPALYSVLTDIIPPDDAAAKEQVENYFGPDFDVNAFMDVNFLSQFYNLTFDEIKLFPVVTAEKDIVTTKDHFLNDTLTILSLDGSGKIITIKRTRGNGYDADLNYAELIPAEDGSYVFKVNYKAAYQNYNLYRIEHENTTSGDIYVSDDEAPADNTEYSYPVGTDVINFEDVQSGVGIQIRRVHTGGAGKTDVVRFKQTSYSGYSYVLLLNKLIRLYKASNVLPHDIIAVSNAFSGLQDITPEVLSQLFFVNHYEQRFHFDFYDSLVLSGTNISEAPEENQTSQFDRLFNSPPLNGQYFSTDGNTIQLNPDKIDSEADQPWYSAVLKRALQINGAELYALGRLTFGTDSDGAFDCNLVNLSSLYRVKLLADAYGLSVRELVMLLSISSWAGKALASLDTGELNTLITSLAIQVQWLHEQSLRVADVFLMLSDYDLQMTPAINDLLLTLKVGLKGHEQEIGDALVAILAPLTAAGLGLGSTEAAAAVLKWVGQLAPDSTDMAAFVNYVVNYEPGPEGTEAPKFCQVLMQQALIVKSLGLTAGEIILAVDHPEQFKAKDGTLVQDIATVQALSRFHRWLLQCGTSASSVLTALGGGSLTPKLVSQATGLDEQMLAQALAQSDKEANNFTGWMQLDTALQWVDVANILGITPSGVRVLIDIRYSEELPDQQVWVTISALLQGALNVEQSRRLQDSLDEPLSNALSAYAIKLLSSSLTLHDRDDLYNYLLVDNQVSAQVKTTRIAEAIASVQLYVNRVLNDPETGDVIDALAKPFFMDWERYNKRYSTWAGVSQLVFYPENYIDPTLRLGQTTMMDTLLQQIGQSELNDDTIDDGFKNYLTAFEEIADLKVVSAYHESENSSTGRTWFVGVSKSSPQKYYWRSLDRSKFQDGKFAANAWSEWQEITCAATPVPGFIRPVIFKSRLYLVWLEMNKVRSSSTSTVEYTDKYTLKYSYQRYDDSWASPFGYDVSNLMKVMTTDEANKEAATYDGFYSAEYINDNSLVILFYTKEQDGVESANSAGVNISINMTPTILENSTALTLIKVIQNQLDTASLVKVAVPINEHGNISVLVSHPTQLDLITMEAKLTNPSLTIPSAGNLIVNVTPTCTINRDNTYDYLIEGFNKLNNKMESDGYEVLCLAQGGVVYPGNKTPSLAAVINADYPNYGVYLYLSPGDYNTAGMVGPVTFIPMNEPDMLAPPTGQILAENIIGNATDGYLINITDCTTGTEITILDFFDKSLPGFIRVNNNDVFVAVGLNQLPIFDTKDLVLNVSVNGEVVDSISAENGCAILPSFSEIMTYNYNSIAIDTGISEEGKASSDIDISCEFTLLPNVNITNAQSLRVTQEKAAMVNTIMTLGDDTQYLDIMPYRTRLNTLFATQLVEYANSGIDTVLSRETQLLQEPKLGLGFYTTLTLPVYDQTVHGDESWVKIYYSHFYIADNDDDRYLIWSGELSNSDKTSVIIFYPYPRDGWQGDSSHTAHLQIQYAAAENLPADNKSVVFEYNADTDTATCIRPSANKPLDKNIVDSVQCNNQKKEPMDFSGANALYFWELFYYTPMMIAQRLADEQNFVQATRWLNYVWNPAGYYSGHTKQEYYWNTRPLQDDTSWNANPLDSVDPDAVAQSDPMHYRVATFMRYLDLLITRGDSAYRMLERDTLNEAKMWYVNALTLLGDEPYIGDNSSTWSSPRLDVAADATEQELAQLAMLAVRRGKEIAEPLTANSLTGLFLPQYNEKLRSYWQTLAQRLYNLRHNLSIDGQPLMLPVYARPADPSALLSAMVSTPQGNSQLPGAAMPLYRFPVMLAGAKELTSQLAQFGSTLLSITERQDGAALTELFQTQGSELARQSIALQDQTLAELNASKEQLNEQRRAAQSRYDTYSKFYDENVSAGESQAMDLYLSSSVVGTTAQGLYMAGAAANMAPNIFGMADGGSTWGALLTATGIGVELSGNATRIAADKISQSETYRRRREEWAIQRDAAQSEIKQTDSALAALAVRRKAAELQKTYLETQQSQMQAQLTFLQNRFTSQALYNWLRGKLATIYHQFYDLTISRCLMAQMAWQFEVHDDSVFIPLGSWQGTYNGLLAGETLQLNLIQMENAWFEKDARALEVTRTVSLAEIYNALSDEVKFNLSEGIAELLDTDNSVTEKGDGTNQIDIDNGIFTAGVAFDRMAIGDDYPDSLFNEPPKVRKIKQISVTLPALIGPYQDIQAVLGCSSSVTLPGGCMALAVSHGMNDSGLFQLDFNDSKYFPFEGISVDDTTGLTLQFPNATDKQKALLESLTDIILHIRYTIR